jgi:uncharacterized protein YqgC (DUF456 family)
MGAATTLTIMKTKGFIRSKETEAAFSATLILVVLIILPPLGGTAILVGSVAGMIAYLILFRDRFRSGKGSLGPAICTVTAFTVLALIILVMSLIRGRWD